MQPRENTPQMSFAGLTTAYLAGMLVIVIIWGVGSFDGLSAMSSSAAQATLAEKCSEPGAQNLELCRVSQSGSKSVADIINLVQNGGFETPVITNSPQIVPSGTAGFAWDVAWVGPTAAQTVRQPVVEMRSDSPAEGGQYADLDVLTSPNGQGQSLVSLSQFVPTAGGGNYLLSFRFGVDPAADAAESCLVVRWGGREVLRVAGEDTVPLWVEKTLNLSTTLDTTMLEFAGCGPENGFGTRVDDVWLVRR